MTIPTLPLAVANGAEQTPAQHHPYRWRLHRGGITNVWFYWDNEFDFSGGRLVLRGTNGSGKSRALEMLLPFVFDADRRRMDATGSGKVRLEDLMRTGDDSSNRIGYLWVELTKDADDSQAEGTGREYLTVGAMVRHSKATSEAKAWYFTTPRRIGHDFSLQDDERIPLSRDALAEAIGSDRITDSPQVHRERIRTQVFGLTGESGKERFAGLLQLLHTLRSPDVGNRIDEGKLPLILSDALPPLSDAALLAAGEQLDGLKETRDAQKRLEEAQQHVGTFVAVYRKYATSQIAESATTADRAVRSATEAEQEAEAKRTEHDRLSHANDEQTLKVDSLDELEKELEAGITGIRESKAYQDIRDLDDREHRVRALAGTADIALDAASQQREHENELVTEADTKADDTVRAAEVSGDSFNTAREMLHRAGVTAPLPDTISARKSEQQTVTAMVRRSRTDDVEQLPRPTPAVVVLSPNDVPAALIQAGRVREAVASRVTHAGTRLTEAVRLDDERRKVETAEEKAEDAELRAAQAAEQAVSAEDDRDDIARALARGWRSWIAEPMSVELLSGIDWSATAVASLLVDVEALTGDGDPATLAELDDASSAAAAPVRDRHATALADLATADRVDAGERAELETEQGKLLAQHDPEPERPTWVTSAPDGGAPLWRTVDFADHVDARRRAGIESALLAAGLLTASVTDSGLTADDGQVLLAEAGPVAPSPLTDVLVVDAASPMPAERVTAVLSRISMGDRRHSTWIDVNGAWANGPLAGRHDGGAPRYIGAEARAAARLARLAEIDIALALLDEARQRRERERQVVRQRRQELVEHLRTSPRSQALATARSLAVNEARRAAKAAAERDRLSRAALALRHEWTTALSSHREKCAGFGLPSTPAELRSMRRDCEDAVRSVENVEATLQTLARSSAQHELALARVASASSKRETKETEAAAYWRTWHDQESALAAIRKSVGAAAEETKQRLRETEARLVSTRSQLGLAREKAAELGKHAAASGVESRAAADKVRERLGDLAHAAQLLTTQLALPGVAAATVGELSEQMSFAQATSADVDAMVRVVRAKLDRHGAGVDENALIRAQQTLERELSGTIDVHATIDNGIRLVELADATGHRTLMAAADELTRRCEEGAAALSDHEHRVFTDFVLGGVAEELRRRLDQADVLIKAMNASLASIRTSHGIGVKLRWELVAERDSQVARVRDLVRTADDVRPADDTIELTDLLKSMVSDAFLTDQSAGYAAHLTAAMDYRTWHEVQVIITGPAPGQERRISRRAKLSQGETRFVSYVTLFAAVDAYLSGLPDTDTALRLILLDDAFAKVDDRTIGELMGLLVRLDLDFAMTGHALWGCYPQVPALDCYEVRRREGTPAVTTHVHWDGHNRHLRAAR